MVYVIRCCSKIRRFSYAVIALLTLAILRFNLNEDTQGVQDAQKKQGKQLTTKDRMLILPYELARSSIGPRGSVFNSKVVSRLSG